jgi:translation initiation factor 5A
METRVIEVKDCKVGKYVVIDGEPCKVVSIQTAKTGKHGHAKARVEAIGILDNTKRSFVAPVEAKVEAPIIEKKVGQLISIGKDTVQIMDLESYETFELPKPAPDEIEGTLVEGSEVEYIVAMGRKKIMRVR